MSISDRNHLIRIMTGYLDALVANDSSRLELTPNARFTENGSEQALGTGLWQRAMAIRTDTRQDFADPAQGQVGSHFVIDERDGTPAIGNVRLRIGDGGAISEIETMVVHKLGARRGFFRPERMVPDPIFNQPIEPERRASREQLKAVVDKYFDALDGGPWAPDLFDPAVVRRENGVRTANGDNIALQRFNFVVGRRYLIFDEPYQLVFGIFPFTRDEHGLVVTELFKVMDGRIRMIQAVMAEIPTKTWA